MSPQEFLFILIVVAGIGVFACGMSIMRSIKQRSKPLKRGNPPRTKFDEAVAQAADEFRRELDGALVKDRAESKRRLR